MQKIKNSTTETTQTETSRYIDQTKERRESSSTAQKRKKEKRSSNNFHFFESDHYTEISIGKSMAVPDQTLTVKQIYEKHRRQMPIPEKQVYYESEVGFTAQLHNLDKQDRIELLKTVKHNISKARGEYDRQTEEQQKAQEQITQPPLTPETQSA